MVSIANMLQQGLSKDEVDQMLDEFLMECAKKEGGNEADIKFLKDRNLPGKFWKTIMFSGLC